jgi:hypothetical protein
MMLVRYALADVAVDVCLWLLAACVDDCRGWDVVVWKSKESPGFKERHGVLQGKLSHLLPVLCCVGDILPGSVKQVKVTRWKERV